MIEVHVAARGHGGRRRRAGRRRRRRRGGRGRRAGRARGGRAGARGAGGGRDATVSEAGGELLRQLRQEVRPVASLRVHRDAIEHLAGGGIDDAQVAGDGVAVAGELALDAEVGRERLVHDAGRRIRCTGVLQVQLTLAGTLQRLARVHPAHEVAGVVEERREERAVDRDLRAADVDGHRAQRRDRAPRRGERAAGQRVRSECRSPHAWCSLGLVERDLQLEHAIAVEAEDVAHRLPEALRPGDARERELHPGRRAELRPAARADAGRRQHLTGAAVDDAHPADRLRGRTAAGALELHRHDTGARARGEETRAGEREQHDEAHRDRTLPPRETELGEVHRVLLWCVAEAAREDVRL